MAPGAAHTAQESRLMLVLIMKVLVNHNLLGRLNLPVQAGRVTLSPGDQIELIQRLGYGCGDNRLWSWTLDSLPAFQRCP